MHVHLIAVSGTGMGSLAGLFQQLGHEVSGSDVRFDAPMGPALEQWGIRLMHGFDRNHLSPPPDLVVVGNVCRRDNVEARAAIDAGLRYTDMAHAMAQYVLAGTTPVVIAGTHGKTTTSSLCAWLLDQAGKDPGFLIGGLPQNFDRSFRIAATRNAGVGDQSLCTASEPPLPFIVEGDEYDSAFFEKTPKMWHYRAKVAVITSIEHDHVDIYPTLQQYLDAFAVFVRNLPKNGTLIAHAADRYVYEIVTENAQCEVLWYGVQGEVWHGIEPQWLARITQSQGEHQSFSLQTGISEPYEFSLPMPGSYNVANATAALAVAMHVFNADVPLMHKALSGFLGVQRRQQLLACPAGVRVYDDFAHHPTAVRLTLEGLRKKHPQGALIAVFEPRSATACRRTHQHEYVNAFEYASHVIMAPVARDNIDEQQRLDVAQVVKQLTLHNKWAKNPSNVDEIVQLVVSVAHRGDTVAVLSNGNFSGIHQQLIKALSRRYPS